MSDQPAKRSRDVHKSLWFSKAEWERVQRRMQIAGMTDWSKFARATVLDGEVRVERVAFDPSVLRAELARIGNNVNQIARHVNAEDVVTFDEMRATRELLRMVQKLIEDARRSGGDRRGRGEDGADQDDAR